MLKLNQRTASFGVLLLALFLAACQGARKEQFDSFAVTSLTLINADSGQPIPGFDSIPDGAIINLAKLPTRNLNIRANSTPESVGQVVFRTGKVGIVADGPPYAMYGYGRSYLNSSKLGYHSHTPSLGKETLTASPYKDGRDVGRPVTITYEVVDQP
jgi:hypothetical protein